MKPPIRTEALVATVIAGVLVLALAVLSTWASFSLLSGLLGDDDPTPKVAVTRPADTPNTVYVLQSFYDDLTFVDGVFSSKAEAEKWIEDTHGSFERSGRDGIDTYEAGDFTYLITTYEVDDHG